MIQAVRILLLLVFIAGCGGNDDVTPPPSNPDRFLFDRGTEALKERKWLNAREYFRQVVDNYPNSPLRADAKIGIGDSYLGEHTAETLVLADNEFREFLTFYPTHPRADYAQYKLAMSHFEQMRSKDRDQTETIEALEEFQVFFTRFPNSPLMPEVREKWRIARDRLSDHHLDVAITYYRINWCRGAEPRLREVLKEDPEFTHRDSVYFYLAGCLGRDDPSFNAETLVARKAEAAAYYGRLVKEFVESEHLEEAKERVQALGAVKAH
jgi:outer membrane protein assembly factor BamD